MEFDFTQLKRQLKEEPEIEVEFEDFLKWFDEEKREVVLEQLKEQNLQLEQLPTYLNNLLFVNSEGRSAPSVHVVFDKKEGDKVDIIEVYLQKSTFSF